MITNKEFSGYHKTPSETEILRLLTLINYTKMKFGIDYQNYQGEEGGPIKKNTRTNAESNKSMSAAAYAEFTKKLFQFLTIRDTQDYVRLSQTDGYIRPILAELYPEIGEHWGIADNNSSNVPESLLFSHASPGNTALNRLHAKFDNGGTVIRYAKNFDEENLKDPRLAIGRLTISNIRAEGFLDFEIRYWVDSDSELNEAYDSVISGRVIQMNSFFVFVGIEQDKDNPFFMVMKTSMSGNKFKGLILRKHPVSSYFASRVMLAADMDGIEEKISKVQVSELKGVTDRQLGLIRNVSTNNGYGILMLDDN